MNREQIVKRKRGRPKGTTKDKIIPKSFKEIRQEALDSGTLPHVFLHKIMKTGRYKGVPVDLELRIDIAKSIAPYFAPKVNPTTDKIDNPVEAFLESVNPDKIRKLSSEELNILMSLLNRLMGDDQGTIIDMKNGKVEDDQTLIPYQDTLK